LTIVLENLYDPHNGAAVLRSAEGFGITDVHVVEADGRFSACRGVTRGSQKWINVITHSSVAAAAAALKAEGMQLCAAVPGAGLSLGEVEVDRPLAIWFGNEHEGLTEEAIAACDQTLSIPMFGFTRSLNLSVSVALCAADLVARRRKALGAPGDLADGRRAHLRARWYVQSVRGARQIVERLVSK
jgi:tRNA (guanosine-2'-O-)-methyltransferase